MYISIGMFEGIPTANPQETKLLPQGDLEVKRLVAYAKCNRDSYESELGFDFNNLLED